MTSATPEGLQLALLNNRFQGIVRAMMNTLLRTSRSAILNTARDFSCCILTGSDEMLAMAESLPIHVMSGPDLMARTMKELHPDFGRGDAFLNNSPYHGNSHAADWSVLIPVIDDDGVHRYTILAKAHLADCGNSEPTTYLASARDVYEEGALIFPCVKIQEDYESNEDLIRMAQVRIRVPELWYGDFLAVLGAARIGERRLLELIREVGADQLEQYAPNWFDYSEQRMKSAIAQLPAGSISVSGRHDPVPGAPDGIPVNVELRVDVEEAMIEVDLRNNLDCQPCGLNLTEATARTAAMMGVFSSLGQLVPSNAGSFRRLRVLLKENCVVGIPQHPTSCSAATTNLSERVGKCVALAMAKLGEGFGMAEIGGVQPPSMGVISGIDPREPGGPFVNQLVLATTGGAGTPSADGWLNILGVGAAGFLMRDSVEIDEMKYPIMIREQRLIPDSEGAGRFRGTPGAYVEYGPIDGCTMDVVWLTDGTVNVARGVRGGTNGTPGGQHKRDRDGRLSDELGSYARATLKPGETIVSMSATGGGYGPPTERDPDRVAKDVREGWISRGRAADVYGVVLDGPGDVDEPATLRRRTELTQAAH